MELLNSNSEALQEYFGGEIPAYVADWLGGSDSKRKLLTAAINALVSGLSIRGKSGKIHWQADHWTRNDGSLVFGRWDIAAQAGAKEQIEVGRHMGAIHFAQREGLKVQISFKNLLPAGLRFEVSAADANFSLADITRRNWATSRVKLADGGEVFLAQKEHAIYERLLEQEFEPAPVLDNNKSFVGWQVVLSSVKDSGRLESTLRSLIPVIRDSPLFKTVRGNIPAVYRERGLLSPLAA